MATPTTSEGERLEALAAADRTDLDEVYAFFDSLEPVEAEAMLGDWDGGLIATGHAGEALLDGQRWAGKQFNSRDDVNPLICLDDAGERAVNGVSARRRCGASSTAASRPPLAFLLRRRS